MLHEPSSRTHARTQIFPPSLCASRILTGGVLLRECRLVVMVARREFQRAFAASNLILPKEHNWLSDARNVHQLWLTGPTWQCDPTPLVASALQDKHATFSAWSVAQVSEFLEQHDLHGPAKRLRANAARDADLLSMDTGTLVSAVGLTHFAACRVIAARDSFF